jgi:REP element-mobilizing transposase RayT
MLLPLPLQNNIAGIGMARQLRKKSETGVYHVMLRGINRQDIFEDEGDYQQMVSILRGLIDRCDEHKVQLPSLCTFYAYCLMSNHVHLLIQEREENISDVVKIIGVTYAHYFNKKYERNGHLFQDLEELVCMPIEECDQILDIDTDDCESVSDSDVKAFLLMSLRIVNPLMVQSLEKARRNEVLRSALSIGAGIRQLSRLTGVSFGVIQKLKNDH